MTAYEAFAASDDGRKRLARARLRHRVLEVMHESLERSKLTKSDVSRKLGIRKSAVGQVFSGDGNLRVNTIADYLDAMGAEVELRLVPRGTPRVKCAVPGPTLAGFDKSTLVTHIHEGGRVRPDSIRPWDSKTLAAHG
ncbi:helix-turn-helix domain-containing protein [Pimelobacter simplex]|uniref:helix-turn-helix domain-containing protein n=1 Tax=Nocardioides simplex TaxID=2045 RepID=UPI003AAF19F0